MKRFHSFALLIPWIIFQSSCEKFDGELCCDDYLIFGTYYSECPGNCATLYKIEGGQLFEDDIDYFWESEEILFKETALDDSKYEIAKSLVETFPNELLKSDKRVYGCPDCLDQGGIFLELKNGKKVDTWNIDPLDNGQNQAIIDYKTKVWEVMQEL